MNPTAAEKALYEIGKDKDLIDSYNKYWESITPSNDHEIIRRYVFSFLSVHTSWSGNVRSFQAVDQLKSLDSIDEIRDTIIESRGGNHTTKSRGIYKFNACFKENPDAFKLSSKSSHVDQRNALEKQCHGLGLAKTAFALEMCYPLTAEVVCLDTHMLQLYGYDSLKERNKASKGKTYLEIEQHWLSLCRSYNIAPAVARAIWWDQKQNQTSSTYWTYVFK